MEQKEIYDLIDRFERSSLTVMKIEQNDCKLHLEKGGVQMPPAATGSQATGPAVQTQQSATPAAHAENTWEIVKAPLVGVYYEAGAPGEAPYVNVGDRVTKGQVLCLVEAMKMMNELKSPIDGIVRSIKGVSGQLVEYDQILFEVEPC